MKSKEERLQKQLARWAVTREMGERRFIWISGVLVRGVTMAIGFLLINWLFNTDGIDSVRDVVRSVIVFLIVGYFGGRSTWRRMERLFVQHWRSDGAIITINDYQRSAARQ